MPRSFLRSDRVRVVVNALHAKSGGGLTYLRELLPNLADDPDFELHLFLHKAQFADFMDLDERVRIHVFAFPPGFKRLIAWEQVVLPFMVREISADIVLSPANYGPLTESRQVIVLQNSLAVGRCESRWRKKLYWTALGLMTMLSLFRARGAVAVSNYVVRTALRLPASTRERITVVHHGVAGEFHPGDVPREDFLLAVGDLYVQKNFFSLVEAVERLRRKRPDIKLKIAGRPVDQSYTDQLLALIRHLGVGANIEILGHCSRETVSDLMRRCKVFVFPSIEESFGMPVLEAMASGCAVACSDAAAMPEVAGDAVEYFAPLDVDGMAAVIERLLDDAALRQARSDKALARAAEFRWQDAGRKVAAVLKAAARSKA